MDIEALERDIERIHDKLIHIAASPEVPEHAWKLACEALRIAKAMTETIRIHKERKKECQRLH